MAFELTGKLVAKYDTIQRTETFKVREFVLETTEDAGGRIINNYIKFQCTQDRTAMPDRFNIGDEVKVQFNLRGTKWAKEGKENYFTNLDAWRMEHVKLAQTNANAVSQAPQTFSHDEIADDLPF